MSFFAELKRRNVFRVAIAYAVTAWLLAQIAGLAAATFGAPDWVMKMFVTFLVLGLPLAMVFAWAYELTPEGLRREKDIAPGVSRTDEMAGKLDRTITVVLVLAVAYFAFDKFVLDPRRDAEMLESVQLTAGPEQATASEAAADLEPADSPLGKSIAVLPFLNMSDDPGNEYFAEGLSEELLNLLVRIPDLKVAARTSSFSYKGKDVKIAEIGTELGVSNVLEGSVRRAGNQVRITAQLIQATDGFHLWSQTYNRTLDDIFAVQDEIARAVVDALKTQLLTETTPVHTTDPEVYQLYLEGQYLSKQGTREGRLRGVEKLIQALAQDPEYAPAWAQLGINYVFQSNFDDRDFDVGYQLAREALQKAIALDERLAIAWSALGYIQAYFDWDLASARDSHARAMALEPGNIYVLDGAALIPSMQGQPERALELRLKALELDPLSTQPLDQMSFNYMSLGRYDEAEQAARRLQVMTPGHLYVDELLARVLLLKGDTAQALEVVNGYETVGSLAVFKAMALHDLGRQEAADTELEQYAELSRLSVPYYLAHYYAWIGDADMAFDALDRALQARLRALAYTLGNPVLLRLRDDPRWPDLLAEIGLLEAWLEMPPEHGGPTP